MAFKRTFYTLLTPIQYIERFININDRHRLADNQSDFNLKTKDNEF